MTDLLFTTTLVAALGCGLIAGAFFAFSSFVMQSLGRIPVREGLVAMQSINIVVINPLFIGVFAGTAVICVLLALAAFAGWFAAGSAYLLAGSVLYVVGCFGVTMACNVPLNNMLAALVPGTPDSERRWGFYQANWTRWNHVRTIGSLAAMVAFILALCA